MTSTSELDVEKWQLFHKQLLTKAMASENVACFLLYHAAVRCHCLISFCKLSATNVTTENNPNKQGVLRPIAKSLLCRWVSIPRCRRDSSNVTSICHRLINQARISSGR